VTSATPHSPPADGQVLSKRELARREGGRRFLIHFTEFMAPWYSTQQFHKLIAKGCEDVERFIRTKGKQGHGRLIIQLPPRYGKSEEVSGFFPAWFLGRNPDMRVILTSYASDLANVNSRKVRTLVSDPEYAKLFGERSSIDIPVGLADDSSAVSGWDLAAPYRGGLTAAGLGSGLTGKGGHLLIPDDMYKSREDAESESYRTRVIDWWGSVATQRLEDFAGIVIIMTRWHPDDLIGYLLKEMVRNPLADQWKVISLPAMAYEPEEYAQDEAEQRQLLARGIWKDLKDPLGREPSQVLWPSKFPQELVEKRKANMPTYEWLALHQQLPRSRTGGFFKVEWKKVDRAPEDLLWFRVWDLAVSAKKKADSTCSAAIAFDRDGTLYIRDMVKWQADWPTSRQRIIDFSQTCDPGEIWGVEQVAFQLAALQELWLEPQMLTRAVYSVVPEDNKVSMALPLQARQAIGKVALVTGPWNKDFEDDASVFPRPNADDDTIDTVTKGMQLCWWYASQHADGEDEIAVYDERVEISPI
jgi:hypothetical protein